MSNRENTDSEAAEKRPRQFELWRLFAAMLFVAIAAGLLRIAWSSVTEYGGGLYPTLLIVTSLLLLIAATGVLFRRALRWALNVFLRIVDILLHFGSP